MLLVKFFLIFGIVLIHVPGFLAALSVLQDPCRSSCIRNALFREYKQDYVLVGHVLRSVIVQTPLDCSRNCIQDPLCQSFNCEHVTKPTLLCELNSETKETKPAFYVQKPGFTYHDALGPGAGWCESVCSSAYNKAICSDGFAGSECQIPMRSCKNWLDHGFNKDGIYHVVLAGIKPFPIYCDQTTDGGGWAVIQRRHDDTVDFYRRWHDYKTGFGDLNGEFWVGNDFIHLATMSSMATELRVELETFEGNKSFAKYNSFNVSDEKTNYTLSVSGYTGTAGDSLGMESGNNLTNTINNNMPFSTWDSDHDNHKGGGNCAAERKGAWWFNDCYWSHLNGPYKGKGQINGINWYSFTASNFKSLKRCSMKIRQVA